MLWDAARKIIDLSQEVSENLGLSAWRQHRFNCKQIKISYRQAQKIKHSTSKDEEKKKERAQQVIQAHQAYCDQAKTLIEKAEATVSYAVSQLATRGNKKNDIENKTQKIQVFIAHAKRQIDQVERRIIHGKSIPHDEKVFSLFAEHTEWISKGKAGVPVELGLRVCILEDQHGFILHHKVMEKTTDDQIAVRWY